jgi:hypothetical protein
MDIHKEMQRHTYKPTLSAYEEKLQISYDIIISLMEQLSKEKLYELDIRLLLEDGIYDKYRDLELNKTKSIRQTEKMIYIVNEIFTKIIRVIKNINSLTLIGSLDSTQEIIDSYTTYPCSIVTSPDKKIDKKIEAPFIKHLQHLKYLKEV